ncbi:MAG TPA: hypothetical protein VN428_15240 [Bryobacteraceae bacterium]|nr:hypothetical protein [Bryobacteraceae bacterium]
MDWVNVLGKYIDRQVPGSVNPGEQHVGGEVLVHRDFEAVAQRVPRSSLVEGLAAAFRSPDAPGFGHMLSRLFSAANPEQRAGLLAILLTIAPAAVRGDLAGLFGRNREVKPEETHKVSPEMVRRVADEAERRDPGVVDRISEFLAEHPRLLKNLDISSLSTAMANIGQRVISGRGTMTGSRGA